MTVRDLLTRAMGDLGILGAGPNGGVADPSAEDLALGLDRLNDWIDGLKTERLSVYAVTRQTWTLTTASSYTVGSGATVNIDRPVSPNAIQAIGYQDTTVTPAQETLLGRPLTIQAYAAIPNKALTAPLPAAWYYNPTFDASGYASLIPWPIPTGSGLQGVIYAPASIAEFATVDTTVLLPPGYRRFLRTNVAVEIAPAFHIQPDQALLKAAMESKANIKRANERLVDLATPDVSALFGGSGPSNIYTGI